MATAPLRGRLVLLVDDDPAVRQAVAGLLRDEGARTLEAGDTAARHEHGYQFQVQHRLLHPRRSRNFQPVSGSRLKSAAASA